MTPYGLFLFLGINWLFVFVTSISVNNKYNNYYKTYTLIVLIVVGVSLLA